MDQFTDTEYVNEKIWVWICIVKAYVSWDIIQVLENAG